MTPEAAVKQKVKEIFKRHGVWYYMPVPTGYSTNGVPDFVACANGWFLGVECKAKDNAVPTSLQALCIDRIIQNKGHAYLATPGNLKGLEELIRNLIAR